MVFQTVLQCYGELSTRTKLVIAGAAVVCGFAGCAVYYYRKEYKENIKSEPTDEALEVSEEDSSRQLRSIFQEKNSTTAVSDAKDLLEVFIPPPDSIKVCLPSHVSGNTVEANFSVKPSLLDKSCSDAALLKTREDEIQPVREENNSVLVVATEKIHTVSGDENVVTDSAPRECRDADVLVNKISADDKEDGKCIPKNEPQQVVLVSQTKDTATLKTEEDTLTRQEITGQPEETKVCGNKTDVVKAVSDVVYELLAQISDPGPVADSEGTQYEDCARNNDLSNTNEIMETGMSTVVTEAISGFLHQYNNSFPVVKTQNTTENDSIRILEGVFDMNETSEELGRPYEEYKIKTTTNDIVPATEKECSGEKENSVKATNVVERHASKVCVAQKKNRASLTTELPNTAALQSKDFAFSDKDSAQLDAGENVINVDGDISAHETDFGSTFEVRHNIKRVHEDVCVQEISNTSSKRDDGANSTFVFEIEIPFLEGRQQEILCEEHKVSTTKENKLDTSETEESVEEQQHKKLKMEAEETIDQAHKDLTVSVSQCQSTTPKISIDKTDVENKSKAYIGSFTIEEPMHEKCPEMYADRENDFLKAEEKDVSTYQEGFVTANQTEENKEEQPSNFEHVASETVFGKSLDKKNETDDAPVVLISEECEALKTKETITENLDERIVENKPKLADIEDNKVLDSDTNMREQAKEYKSKSSDSENESKANTEETNLLVSDGFEASTMLMNDDFVVNKSSTTHVQSSPDSCKHIRNAHKTIKAQDDSKVKQGASANDNTYEGNFKPQIKDNKNSEAEKELLFIDTSSWRDKLCDDDINFLMCILSVDVGDICDIEAKVNLNRQKYRVSFEREARAELLYNVCKEKTFEFSSEVKVSAGGVRYGLAKYKLNDNEYYQPKKKSPTNKREAQYIFLDEDDVIDVTNNPEHQQQFLNDVDLKDCDDDEEDDDDDDEEDDEEDNADDADDDVDDDDDDEEGGGGGEGEREFGYLEEMLNDEEDTVRLGSQHPNQIPNYFYQNYGQERSNSGVQSPPSNRPQGSPYNTYLQQPWCSHESGQSTSSDQPRGPPYSTYQQPGWCSQQTVNSGVHSLPSDQPQGQPHGTYQRQPCYSQERVNSNAQTPPSDQFQGQQHSTYQQQSWYSQETVNTGFQSLPSDQFRVPSYTTNQHQVRFSRSNTACSPGYNTPYSQRHFQGPAGGYHPRAPTGQGSFYPQWDQYQFQQRVPNINPWQYSTQAPRHGHQWQQQGARPFTQHGTTYFHTQTQPFVLPAAAHEWNNGYQHAGVPRPF